MEPTSLPCLFVFPAGLLLGFEFTTLNNNNNSNNYYYCYYYLFFLIFLGPHLWHREVPRLGVESELQLLACTTATAVLDQSCIFDRHHSSGKAGSFNPLSEARDRTRILMDISRVSTGAATGTPSSSVQWAWYLPVPDRALLRILNETESRCLGHNAHVISVTYYHYYLQP